MRNGVNYFHARRPYLQIGPGQKVGYGWQHHRHHRARYLADTEGLAAPLGGASSHALGSFAEKAPAIQ